jgi:uncharacterized protein (DUF58 family)
MVATPGAQRDARDAGGVYVTLDELVRIRHRATGFSFLPRQPIHNLLAGRHASRLRGRGLNFEEIRGYLPGDDVRTIDWKVTARTRTPHVRVFTEERDRPALLVVDQRLDMFYGTRVNMKSVTAAHVAAAAAWRVLDVGDRVGGVVFDDTELVSIRPQRSQATVMRLLSAVVAKNRALRADAPGPADPAMLDATLDSVARTATHDYLVVVISDFAGLGAGTERLMTRIAQHNDVIACPVWDPSATELPRRGELVVSNGELQVQLSAGDRTTRRKLVEMADNRLATVMHWQRKLGVPVLPFRTDRDVLEQVRGMLGRLQTARR